MPITITLTDEEAHVLDYIGERAYQDDHKPLEAHDEWRNHPEWTNVAASIIEKVRDERKREAHKYLLAPDVARQVNLQMTIRGEPEPGVTITQMAQDRMDTVYDEMEKAWPERNLLITLWSLPKLMDPVDRQRDLDRILTDGPRAGLNYVVGAIQDPMMADQQIHETIFEAVVKRQAVPAGAKNGTITSLLAFEPTTLTAEEQDLLYDAGFNFVRQRQGVTCLWGHRLVPTEGSRAIHQVMDPMHTPMLPTTTFVRHVLYGPAIRL